MARARKKTVRSHWEHTLEQLEVTYKVVSDLDPERLSSFNWVLVSRKAYMFYMLIMRTKLLDGHQIHKS